MRIKIVIIIILIVLIILGLAFMAGIYFKDDVIKFYNIFNQKVQTQVQNQTQNFQKTEIGSVISKVSKEVLTSTPLNVGGSTDSKITLLQSKVILETNAQRLENGPPAQAGNLLPLKENTKLNEAASAKANDLFLKQYFEHVSPTGIDPGQLVQSYGYEYIVTGENLILGNFSSEKEVVQAWMDSPEHRENILNNRYTEIGVAIIKGTYKGETVWIGVQEFGLPLSACTSPSIALKNQIDSNTAQINLLSVQVNESKKQIDSTDPNSLAYRQMVDDYNKLVGQYNSLADITKGIVVQYNKEVNNFNVCVANK